MSPMLLQGGDRPQNGRLWNARVFNGLMECMYFAQNSFLIFGDSLWRRKDTDCPFPVFSKSEAINIVNTDVSLGLLLSFPTTSLKTDLREAYALLSKRGYILTFSKNF